jgi:photosystem II PsbY protein
MDIDFRILIVVAPVVLAGSWAIFNILSAALNQINNLPGNKK